MFKAGTWLRLVVVIAAAAGFCGCNVMTLSENQKKYAKSIECSLVAQDAVRYAKKNITDPLACGQVKSFYLSAVREGNAFLETAQRAVKDNMVDDKFYDSHAAMERSFEELISFVRLAGEHIGHGGAVLKNLAAAELEAGVKGRAEADAFKAALKDKKFKKDERVKAAIVTMGQNSWPSWEQIK